MSFALSHFLIPPDDSVGGRTDGRTDGKLRFITAAVMLPSDRDRDRDRDRCGDIKGGLTTG